MSLTAMVTPLSISFGDIQTSVKLIVKAFVLCHNRINLKVIAYFLSSVSTFSYPIHG